MTQLDRLNSDRRLYAAEVAVTIGRHARLDLRMSSAGLLSIGALVSGILLSAAVIVQTARRNVAAKNGGSANVG